MALAVERRRRVRPPQAPPRGTKPGPRPGCAIDSTSHPGNVTGVPAGVYRRHTGDELDSGEVTLWEPPRRLRYLWHLRRDRADATDVEITFTDLGDATTRVVIEHRGWERLGALGQQWRDANRAGWGSLLPHFTAACAKAGELG